MQEYYFHKLSGKMKFQKILLFIYTLFLFNQSIWAQEVDSMNTKELSPVTIQALRERNELNTLEPVSGNYIFSGKKSEVIPLKNADVNITDKTARQLFAKVPGIFVYDMEGSNQINISARGLDPHRGWEFNLRKDNIIINSDLYAYPASHYSIPMESVERIELVRGTGALEYGAQFGGMLNYVCKQGNPDKVLNFENYTSIGSYNLLSTYNAIGGTKGRFRYYTYYAKKSKDGYRDNEHTNYDAQGLKLQVRVSKHIDVKFDYVRSNYLYRIPGPLNDSMFQVNPKQATRFRNYFNPIIHVPSIVVNWQINNSLKFQYSSSAVLGKRQSVIFDKPATIIDSLSTITHHYANRQVDIDEFNSYTNELRLLKSYQLWRRKHTCVLGVQYLNNNLHRSQLGKGTVNSDYDLSLVDPQWGRDMHFKTENLAIFIENNFSITPKLSFNLGSRLEVGESKMSGIINYYPENSIPVNIKHEFPLFGGGFNYKLNYLSEFYGGISEAYRPVLFKDIIPASIYEKVNPDIKDANGINLELGYRGKNNRFSWDISSFLLKYNNRFGTIVQTDSLNNFITYRTNIGNSLTSGVELFFQYSHPLSSKMNLTLFTATAFMNGIYTSGNIKTGTVNNSIKNNKVESIPDIITRNGMTWQLKKCSMTLLLSYTGKSYADPANTELPNNTGSVGFVPSYILTDLNLSYQYSDLIGFRFSFNNIFNEQYFTKRPLFYPGPGVWPSDGRNGNMTVIFRL